MHNVWRPRLATILAAGFFVALCASTNPVHASGDPQSRMKLVVDATILPLMAKYRIPGMAIGITLDGKRYVFNYGLASTQPERPVTRDTLFELGSVSKTLTATLASYAQVRGYLSLSDPTSKFLPRLRGTQFGDVPLLNLGTHTPGGIPLQVPDGINNDDQLMHYLMAWKPIYARGSYRTYSNIGIGILGMITAKSMRQDFSTLMEQRIFPMLGMKHSFINVPETYMNEYAQGYTRHDTPIRMSPGVLWSEAYGVRTTAADMIRFVEANMHSIKLNETLMRAISNTHIGYFKAGAMTQDLIWEQYPYPVTLKTLLAGNSPAMIFDATPATAMSPTQPPREDVWINKTGSTNGFSTYIAFVPEKHMGIVILSNKGYPINKRVTAAYTILTALADQRQ